MTKAKLTRIPKRVLACVLAVLMVLSCLTMLPFTGFAATKHADLESPAVVQVGSNNYYAFGSGNKWYQSDNMANWTDEGSYVDAAGLEAIADLFGSTVTGSDLKSPEVISYDNGTTWHLYLSLMNGSRSMIVVGTSTNIEGPYSGFKKVLETGFARNEADSVLQGYFDTAYTDGHAKPASVAEWGKGTCYYYSNILGLFSFSWYTEQLPMAYAPSIAKDSSGNYWMAYGYRNGGIWMQKINPATGLIDFTWSGDNYEDLPGGWQESSYQYVPEDDYDSSSVGEARLDPYFGELVAHTTQGGDTDTVLSSVTRAGEEPELYFANGKMYLQVSYGGSNNSDGYNVRSYVDNNGYSATGVTNKLWNFVDMNSNTAVANADSTMMSGTGATRTGLKLMGDYDLPGATDGNTYYTSPGASSVSTGDNGLMFYNYQVKTNSTVNGQAANTTPELRSHILLHNANGEPLVTPFEYTGSGDASEYNARYGASRTQYDIDEDIVGQYYVTMTGNETSTSMQTYGGITLTAGGIVSGMISGTWDFEQSDRDNTNLIVIHDEANDVYYHGALLKQTVEYPGTLKNLTETMTFTLTGNNQTVWGVWYGKYEPAGENNANAGLEVSPAVYTGGALILNANTNGQLGLKYGNYITAFRFADIDYTTYMMIDDRYEITDVYDYYENSGDPYDGNDFIVPYEVTYDLLNSSNFAESELVQAVYTNREVDPIESGKTGADNVKKGDYSGTNTTSIEELKEALRDKLDEATQYNKRLYVLTGYLESNVYGRVPYSDNDKGDLTLMVEYYDTQNDSAMFRERVYSHVYQQPVSANVSGAIYRSQIGSWLRYYHYTNTAYMRAEGSYASDSYYPGYDASTSNIRNSTVRDSGGNKKFVSKGLYLWYNPTLFTNSPQYYGGTDPQQWFHGEVTSILTDRGSGNLSFNGGDHISMNGGYRANENSSIDVATSYETTLPDDNQFNLVAGPRANYYIDISSADTSNIASYINYDGNNGIRIPLYYSSIPVSDNGNTDYFRSSEKTFSWNDGSGSGRYLAGLYPASSYNSTPSTPLGNESSSVYQADYSYGFWADFKQVETAYDDQTLWLNPAQSDSANIWIYANYDNLSNTQQAYNADNYTDYNFFVRTKSETEFDSWSNNTYHLRLVEDMEYGVYVTDKSYLRNYYNQVMENKQAQNYTYYSWETFRDATRLIADYLNNYMQLADMYQDRAGDNKTYDPVADYDAQIQAGYLNTANELGGVKEVLTNESAFNQMLAVYSSDTQGVLCFLLTAAENQLFEYSTYQDFMDAYDNYNLAMNQMGSYTASSWKAYLEVGLQELGSNISLDDLTLYVPEVNDKDTGLDQIYDPSHSEETADLNCSWKIINDDFFGDDTSAREFFEEATRILEEATNILRRKADYSTLDAAMKNAAPYNDNHTDMNGVDVATGDELTDAGIDSITAKDSGIFSIDRSTVRALAQTVGQGSSYTVAGTGSDADGDYTVSSIAAFDKIVDHVYEVSGEHATAYEDKIASPDATNDYNTPAEGGAVTEDNYYSNLVRDDQKRYADADPQGDDTSKNSDVQERIYDKADLVQDAVDQLTKLADDDQYETFDYLIDVISTIDFNAYTDAGQEKLWKELYELLVKGGVYAVNQQLFAADLSDTDTATAFQKAVYDGDEGYYTGLNASDVDEATTELMSLLTDLNDYQRRPVMLNVEVYMTETSDATSADKPYAEKTYDLHYGDLQSVNIKDFINGYSPEDYFAYSWVITTDDATSYLGGLESYDFTAAQDTTLKIYVAEMSNPSAGVDPVRVTVRNRYGGQSNEFVMSLMPNTLSAYSVLVSEDGSSLTIMHDGARIGRTVDAGRVPFYTFKYWTINGKPMQAGETYNLGDITGDAITILSTYEADDSDFTVTVNGTTTSGFVFDDKVTITANAAPDGKVFYAWIVDDAYNDTGNESELTDPYSWKIASYNLTYTYLATASERFIQVNTDNDGHYYLQTGEEIPVQPADGVLNATSLYYRLEHKLADSWSNITKKYDTESGKVSLFSHFTDMGDSQARVTEHGIVAITNPSSAGIASNRDLFVIGTQGVNQAVSHTDSSSGQSSGQYVVSIVIPEQVLDGRTIYMRSYVTTSYMLNADDLDLSTDDNNPLGSSNVFVTNYSEIASVKLPGADAPTTTEDGSTEEE